METPLGKYLGAVDLAVIALCAIFGARATATAIESSFVGGIPSAKHAARPVASASPAVYTKQVEEILRRNIFCSTCPPILPVPVVETAGPPVDPPPQRTTLPLKLLAIMFAPPPSDPRWSMAIIRDTDEKTSGAFSIGAKVREATITDISEIRVDFDVAGRKEYLELFDKGPAAPAPVAAVAAPSGDPLMAELEKGLKKTGEHTFEVQRSAVDSLLGNMSGGLIDSKCDHPAIP